MYEHPLYMCIVTYTRVCERIHVRKKNVESFFTNLIKVTHLYEYFQDALVKRLGSNAYAFTMEIIPLAPPSVQLVPAKEYTGAPIGTSYDVRAYVGE